VTVGITKQGVPQTKSIVTINNDKRVTLVPSPSIPNPFAKLSRKTPTQKYQGIYCIKPNLASIDISKTVIVEIVRSHKKRENASIRYRID